MIKILNFLGSFAAMILALMALYLWYADGAWEQGQLSTDGMTKTVILSCVAILSFGILRGLNKK